MGSLNLDWSASKKTLQKLCALRLMLTKNILRTLSEPFKKIIKYFYHNLLKNIKNSPTSLGLADRWTLGH